MVKHPTEKEEAMEIQFGTYEYDRYKYEVLVDEVTKEILLGFIKFNNAVANMPSRRVNEKAYADMEDKLERIIVTADEGTEEHGKQHSILREECEAVYVEALRRADHRWENAMWTMGLID